MATYAEVIYCKNCKYFYEQYCKGKYSEGGYLYVCERRRSHETN